MLLYYDSDEFPDARLRILLEEIASWCVGQEGLMPDNVSLSVSFVDSEDMRALNARYRGIDESTDVLSFPQWDDVQAARDEGELNLGDVVLCMDEVERQATELNHSVERELLYLFVHGLLHLLGYDHVHDDERADMREREKRAMQRLEEMKSDEKEQVHD